MFYSQDILAKKGKLGAVWIAANFHGQAGSGTRLTLTRREYCNVDIEEACHEIVFPSRPFALRLSAYLMVGVIRIYKQQTHYVYLDLKQIWQSLKSSAAAQKSAIDLPKTKPRSELLPDVLNTVALDSSFSCLQNPGNISFELPPYSESDYFIVDIDTMMLPPLPETPDIRPGSVEGSPFTTDPRNITLQEDDATPLESLQIQVPGEQDFGDGDMEEVLVGPVGPVALLGNVPMPLLGLSPSGEAPVAEGGSDYSTDMVDADTNGVLLYDEELGDFRVYSSGPSPQGPHVGSHQSQPPPTPTIGGQATQSAGPSAPFVLAPKLQSRGEPGHTPRREFRRKKAKRKLAYDAETKLKPAAVKRNLSDGSSTLREVPWKMPKRATAKVLFSQPCCTIIGRSKIFRPLWERGANIEREVANEFDLEEIWRDGNGQIQTARPRSILPAAHQRSNPASTLTTPDLEAGRGYSTNFSLGVSGDQERMRGTMRDGEASYNATRNNSAAMTMSDFSGAHSLMSGASFNASSLHRKSPHGRDTQPAMGGLSPITDEDLLDPEMSFTNPADLGFPQLDVSSDSSHAATPTKRRSPFIESETAAYGRRVTTVMHGRQEIEFQKLLPRGSTRRTASRAFAHMLELVSKGVFEAQQEQPYGSITLCRPHPAE